MQNDYEVMLRRIASGIDYTNDQLLCYAKCRKNIKELILKKLNNANNKIDYKDERRKL